MRPDSGPRRAARRSSAANPGGEVVLISGFGTLDTAVEAVRAGAFDYISKPFNIGEVQGDRRPGAGATAPRRRAGGCRRRAASPAGIVGRTAAMLAVYKQIAHAADSARPGADLRARAAPARSSSRARSTTTAAGRRGRSSRVNCGAIAGDAARIGAVRPRARRVHRSGRRSRRACSSRPHGGTVFLDEIGETSPALQVQLLRVLQDGEVRPVGAGTDRAAWTRASSPRPTSTSERAVAEQRFRQDLFYRLSVIVIALPPLRERREDIPLLVEQFLRERVQRAPDAARRLPPRRSRRWRRTAGRATCASSRTPIERLVVFSRGPHRRSTTCRDSRWPASRAARGAALSGSADARRARAPVPAARPPRGRRQPVARGRGAGHRPANALSNGRAFRDRPQGRGRGRSRCEVGRVRHLCEWGVLPHLS